MNNNPPRKRAINERKLQSEIPAITKGLDVTIRNNRGPASAPLRPRASLPEKKPAKNIKELKDEELPQDLNEINDEEWENMAKHPKVFTKVLKLTLRKTTLNISAQRAQGNQVAVKEAMHFPPKKVNDAVVSPQKVLLRRTKSDSYIKNSWDINWAAPKKKVTIEEKPVAIANSNKDTKTSEEMQAALKQIQRELTKSKIVLKRNPGTDFVTVTVNGKTVVTAASLEKLIESITDEDISEDFSHIFLISYRYFTNSSQLFELLVKRYNYFPEDIPNKKAAEQVQCANQLRVIIFLKMWIEGLFSTDFATDKQMFDKLWDFVCTVLIKSRNEKWGKAVKLNIERKISEEVLFDARPIIESMFSPNSTLKTEKTEKPRVLKFKGIGDCFSESQKKKGSDALDFLKKKTNLKEEDSLILCGKFLDQKFIKPAKKSEKRDAFSKNSIYLFTQLHITKSIGVTDYSPSDFTKQLCMIEFTMFRSIRLQEMSSLAFSEKNRKDLALNVRKMIEFSNSISYWVATEILTTANYYKRVCILKHFIMIAKYCKKFHLYNGLFEIMAGLNNGAVRRLGETWKELPPTALEVFVSLEELTSSDDNWRNYRNYLKTLKNNVPIVPYLGLYLKDLTVLEETHQTFEDGLINFKKMTIISKFLDSFVACQGFGYTFEYNGDLQHYILHERITLGEKQLYTQSKFIEPPGEKIKKSTAILDQVIAYSQMGIPSNLNLPKFRNWW